MEVALDRLKYYFDNQPQIKTEAQEQWLRSQI